MDNNLQSRLCIEISSMARAAGQEIAQRLLATDLYVYVELAGKQAIYLPEKNAQYLIDAEKKQLVKVDLTAQAAQLLQVRQLIGELSVEEKQSEQPGRRYLRLANINRAALNFEAEAEVMEVDGLEQTALGKFEEFQAAIKPISVKVKANEVVASLKSTLTVTAAGQVQESSTTVLDVKKLENPQPFDRYLEFSIVSD
jgi:hypothetical protein